MHLPSSLPDQISLTQEMFPASYDLDQVGMELVNGTAGLFVANHSIVPAGKYRYYYGANVFHSGAVRHRVGFGLSNNAGLLIHLDSSGDSGYWTTAAAVPGFNDLNAVGVNGADEFSLKHPCVVPQGFNFFGFADLNNATPVDAAIVVSIVVMFRERNIGEPYHSI